MTWFDWAWRGGGSDDEVKEQWSDGKSFTMIELRNIGSGVWRVGAGCYGLGEAAGRRGSREMRGFADVFHNHANHCDRGCMTSTVIHEKRAHFS